MHRGLVGSVAERRPPAGTRETLRAYATFATGIALVVVSPAEPQTEKKWCVEGIGEVAEQVVKGHHERFQLVRVTH